MQIHGRWPRVMTLDTLVSSYNKDISALTLHLYTAYRQWDSCKLTASSLAPGEATTQEDYQMNCAVRCSNSHSPMAIIWS